MDDGQNVEFEIVFSGIPTTFDTNSQDCVEESVLYEEEVHLAQVLLSDI